MNKTYRIKLVEKSTEDVFLARYKGHHIEINREEDGRFYIHVRSPSGAYCYDGWWPSKSVCWRMQMNQAIDEALKGSMLHPLTRSKGGES